MSGHQVLNKTPDSCHAVGLVSMHKQQLLLHNCTTLGWAFFISTCWHFCSHFLSQTITAWLVCLTANISWLLRASGLRPFHKTFLASPFPTGMQMQIIFLLTVKIQLLYSSHSSPAGDTSQQGLWTEQDIGHGAGKELWAGADATKLTLLRWQQTRRAAEEMTSY